jgi:hypothetical protein
VLLEAVSQKFIARGWEDEAADLLAAAGSLREREG